MNILLLSPRFPIAFYNVCELTPALHGKTVHPPLGLLTVAALLPADWTLRLVDANIKKPSRNDFDFADAVFVSAMLPQRDSTLDLIRDAKKRGQYVVVGGPYPSSLPDELLAAGADLVVQGEAELLKKQIVQAVEARTQGLVLKAEGWASLSDSPIPRFDLLDMDDYLGMIIQTSRGCPHNCEFCDVVNLNGRRPRCKEPDQVLAELDALRLLGWRGTVLICDDNFIGNQGRARQLLKRLVHWSKSHGEPFSFGTQASIELARNKELIDLMTEACIGEVFIGVETPDEDVLTRSNKKHNVSNPLAESLRFINANGMRIQCSFIIGLDGEKPGAGEKIAQFAQDLGMPQVMLNILYALPGTALWKRLSKAGRVLAQCNTQDLLYGLTTNVVTERPLAQVVGEFVSAITSLYSPANYLDRCFNHIMRMRPTRAALGQTETCPTGQVEHCSRRRGKKQLLRELRMVTRLFWQLGILGACQRQFWRQFLIVIRKHPSRLNSYISLCIACGVYAEFAKRSRARAKVLDLAPALC